MGISALPGAALATEGWYVGGTIGANLLEKQDWKIDYENNNAFRTDGPLATVDIEEGFAGGLLGGYAFSAGLRLELEVQRRRNEISSIDLAPMGLLNAGGPASSHDGVEVADMAFANAWFDLFASRRLHPYIGGGAGAARVSIKDGRYNSTNLRENDDTGFAWQAGAGVAFDLNPQVTLSLDYRYVDAGELSYDLLGGDQPSKVSLDYRADSVLVSVRYAFGAPKAEPMPEMKAEAEPVQVVEPIETTALADAPAADSTESVPAQDPTEAAPADGCNAPGAGEAISLDGCKAGDTLVLRGVTFEYNSAELTPDSRTILDQVADELTSAGAINVELSGHTDSAGDDSYNQALSERRAASVKQYLAERGIDPARLQSHGFGETQPVAGNETEDGRRLNRRVELKVIGSDTPSPGAEPAADAATLPQAAAAPPAPDEASAPPVEAAEAPAESAESAELPAQPAE